MRRIRALLLLVILLVFVPLAAPNAFAFGVEVHGWLAEAALRRSEGTRLERMLPPASEQDLAAFRNWVYRQAADHREMEIRALFRGRFPSPEHFDAWAFKEWLMLNPQARIWGIDIAPEGPRRAGEAWAEGARHPDEDRRNQDRHLHDSRRRVRLDPATRAPLPYDPAILLMGNASGPSSQAHAHCQLVRAAKTRDPEILRRQPWLFAVPPGTATYGADQAQVFTDLASLAELWGGPGGEWLRHEFQGNAWHYIADAGYQLHVVQVGSYEVYQDARRRVFFDRIKAFFLRGTRPPTVYQHGRATVGNLREFGSEMLDQRLFAGDAAGTQRQMVLSAPRRRDEQLHRDLALVLKQEPPCLPGIDQATPRMPAWRKPFGRALTHAVASRSARESESVSRSLLELGSKRLRGVGFSYRCELHDPADFLRDDDVRSAAALASFYDLEARGFQRVGEAIRRHLELCREVTAGADPQEREFRQSDIVARLVLGLHAYHKRARKRREQPEYDTRVAHFAGAGGG